MGIEEGGINRPEVTNTRYNAVISGDETYFQFNTIAQNQLPRAPIIYEQSSRAKSVLPLGVYHRTCLSPSILQFCPPSHLFAALTREIIAVRLRIRAAFKPATKQPWKWLSCKCARIICNFSQCVSPFHPSLSSPPPPPLPPVIVERHSRHFHVRGRSLYQAADCT